MSKGLEALEEIKNARLIDHVEIKEGLFSNKLLGYKRRYGEDVFYKQIPIIEKELKALEIVKNKPQAEISLFAWGKIKTYEEYLKKVGEWDEGYGDLILTQEEFDLLKEVLL